VRYLSSLEPAVFHGDQVGAQKGRFLHFGDFVKSAGFTLGLRTAGPRVFFGSESHNPGAGQRAGCWWSTQNQAGSDDGEADG